MKVDEQKEFDEAVNNLSRKLKTKLSKLWEKAKDKNYVVQERAQVIIAGLIAYDSGHNRSFIQQFDRDYKLGESIAKSITAITTQALEQSVEYVPDDRDETEYLARFRQMIPTVIFSNRENILGVNVKEVQDTAVTRTFFVELYALRKLNDLSQGSNEPLKVIEQMEWLGTQKELAELHIELMAKGWIKKFHVNTIRAAYTKSDTLKQVMKSNESVKMGDQLYDQIYTPKIQTYVSCYKTQYKRKIDLTVSTLTHEVVTRVITCNDFFCAYTPVLIINQNVMR